MPKGKAVDSSSGMVDSDMEDDTLAKSFPTPDSNQENAQAKKRGRQGKSNAKKFSKPRARRSGDGVGSSKTANKPKTGSKRAPLKEQKNAQQAEDTEEVDEFDAPAPQDTVMEEANEVKQPKKRAASKKKAGRPPKQTAEALTNEKQKDGEFEYTPTIARQSKRMKKGDAQQRSQMGGNDFASPRPSQSQEKVIPETQVPVDTEPSGLLGEEQDDEDALPQSVFKRTNYARSALAPRPPAVSRKPADSTLDTEKAGNDPALRQKLEEITRRCETIESKYKTLKETLVKEAQENARNFEAKLHAKSKAADDLIASLRKELSLQKALSRDSRSLQAQITARDADLTKTQALADQLSTSLAESQNENKALQAKLANLRSASTAFESINAKTPGNKTPAARTVMVGSVEAAHAAQIAQLKEDLYCDLTGLILRGIERGEGFDTYDCLQTGPNGTLHFKLGVPKEGEGGYDNAAEFHYTPRLDSDRDRDLITLLPEYLTEEIEFSRTNAAMFYSRIVNCLTRKRPAEEITD
ncbi:hypothetical protein ACLMJK_004971 [Lecanora helva]